MASDPIRFPHRRFRLPRRLSWPRRPFRWPRYRWRYTLDRLWMMKLINIMILPQRTGANQIKFNKLINKVNVISLRQNVIYGM
ncbi:hypothetical protein P5673_015801 [Acropora cervicornis]|uniref:Uncharacterized protein n=1 Tax=Acropora cervicornis TaxID=6130 RepID=A0AAD9QI28_ACRCE|nr:hypothetical protein P5673_015801 [Acropora cervicornis]